MRRTRMLPISLLVATVAALATGASASTVAAADQEATEPPTSVRLEGAWRVVDVQAVQIAQMPTGTPIPARQTTLESKSTSMAGSCTIQVVEGAPTLNISPTGGRNVSGYAQIETSSGCSPVTWSHAIYTHTFRNGNLTWVRRGILYSATVQPGSGDYDLRSSGCNGSNTTTWKNDTNFTSGTTASLACYLG